MKNPLKKKNKESEKMQNLKTNQETLKNMFYVFFKHNWQTDGQNNVKARYAHIKELNEIFHSAHTDIHSSTLLQVLPITGKENIYPPLSFRSSMPKYKY